mmetsp:Transcript_13056/g.32242  ORF Transcript_13056/g.32242 Transcript_13056/m.32242 type:complete len:111 (+) Transcript_13056:413-745(+)
MQPELSLAEVAEHSLPSPKGGRLWTAIDEKIYDITDYVSKHPGGYAILATFAGADATEDFNATHAKSADAQRDLEDLCIGQLRPEDRGPQSAQLTPTRLFSPRALRKLRR